jgi:predicted Zn-dependent peptidase
MPKFGLMHLLAGFTLFDGDPKLVNTILDGFLAVTTQQVQEAARSVLQSRNRAIVFRKPVEKSAQEAA